MAHAPLTDEQSRQVADYLPFANRMAHVFATGRRRGVPDIYAAAAIGLMDAVTRYEPKGDTKFATYAAYRIRGSMLDATRRPRGKLRRLLVAAGPIDHEPLDHRDDTRAAIDEADSLDVAIATLRPREAAMIRAIYVDGMEQTEAGRRQGIGRSWASIVHADAIRKLRNHYASRID